MGRPRSSRSASGFSLPFVLIAAAILLVGGLMLSLRSSDGLLSVLLQAESSDARDAAETGMTRIVGELNRPRNRGLLVKDGADQDLDDHLWSSGDATSRNPCLPPGSGSTGVDPTAPDLTTNASIGYQAGPPYRDVLLDAQGQVVSNPEDAVKSYRLVAVRRQPLRTADGRPSLRLFDAEGRGLVVITVEGSALRQGRVISTIRLEEELQLVPKCCGVSFGGAHGDVDYATAGADETVCVSASWGFVAGMANNGTGSITINGFTTITDGAGHKIDPLLCVAEPTQECDLKPKSTPFSLELVQPSPLPGVRTNPTDIPGTVMGSIDKDSIPQEYPSASFRPFLYCTNVVSPKPATLKDCPGSQVTIDSEAENFHVNTDNNKYCEPGSYADLPEPASDLHCNLSQLNYSGLAIRVVGTDKRALRFYFPGSGITDVIRSTGGGSLEHVGPAAQFALFGCQSCNQSITLSGSVDGLNLFAWFPKGVVTVAGGSGYQGLIWANQITSNGDVTWTIPPSQVVASLRLARFVLEQDSGGDFNPRSFDWVPRSVRSFQWLGT